MGKMERRRKTTEYKRQTAEQRQLAADDIAPRERRALQTLTSTGENRLKPIAPDTNPIHRVSSTTSRRFATDGDAAPHALPDGWRWARLAEVCTKPQYGYTAKAQEEPIGPRMLRITDIQEGNVDWNAVPYCEYGQTDSEKYSLQTGDILFARTGSVGKSFLIDKLPQEEAVFASYLIRVRALKSIDSHFLYSFLQSSSYWQQIAAQTHGAVQPNVNATQLTTLQIPLPPLPEQRGIAHALRTVQQAQAARQRELTLERERKAALMEHLFTRGTRNEPRKQTEIGEMPESWEIVELRKIADVVYGAQAAVAHSLDKSIGTPILTNINITNEGAIDLSTIRYYKVPEGKRDRLILKKGDLLFNWRSGSQYHVGKTALFDFDGEFTFSSFILRFRTREMIDSHFLLYHLYRIKAQGFFSQNRQQSSVNSVFNASVAATIPVILPSLDEQLAIATSLRACDAKIAALEREAQVLDELFRALLDELMTGRLSTIPLIGNE